jgi:Uma2 family endonuclease
VTSDGTEDYDRGEKLEHYKQIPSLEAVVIVSHREQFVEVWSRGPRTDTWSCAAARAGAAHLAAIQCSLDVDAVYAASKEPR